jgi:D-hexose-6-phosphate mutarotase
MEPDGYRSFICAEPANAYEGVDMIELEPGKSFSLSTIISVV